MILFFNGLWQLRWPENCLHNYFILLSNQMVTNSQAMKKGVKRINDFENICSLPKIVYLLKSLEKLNGFLANVCLVNGWHAGI
jgi:hypothetical protein